MFLNVLENWFFKYFTSFLGLFFMVFLDHLNYSTSNNVVIVWTLYRHNRDNRREHDVSYNTERFDDV